MKVWGLSLRLALLALPTPAFGELIFTHVDVFSSGTEGYHTFRIPAILTAPDGALIAMAEGRKENRHDPGGGDIDLVYKRSTDAGATWSPLMVLDDPGVGWAASNPTPVVDRQTGRIWVLYNRWEPGFGTYLSQPGTSNNQVWVRYSDDNGLTWSTPTDLTRVAREFDHWGAMFLGPGGAIQAGNGRLIVPAAMKPDRSAHVWVSVGNYRGTLKMMRAYAIYSHDHGATWQRGELLDALSDENQLVELADGALLMDARQSSGENRWVAISADGGQTWSKPRAGQVVKPVATAIERYTLQASGDDRDRILWSGPSGPGRLGLVVRVSYDEGQTFRNEKLIYGGFSAYSDLSILNDKTVGLLWERGVSSGYQFITLTRFNLEFLESEASTSFP